MKMNVNKNYIEEWLMETYPSLDFEIIQKDNELYVYCYNYNGDKYLIKYSEEEETFTNVRVKLDNYFKENPKAFFVEANEDGSFDQDLGHTFMNTYVKFTYDERLRKLSNNTP